VGTLFGMPAKSNGICAKSPLPQPQKRLNISSRKKGSAVSGQYCCKIHNEPSIPPCEGETVMREFYERIIALYREAFENKAERGGGDGAAGERASLKFSLYEGEEHISVYFDAVAYEGDALINYRRYAQMWDKRGYIVKPHEMVGWRAARGYDGLYIDSGGAHLFKNRFNRGEAESMRRSQYASFILTKDVQIKNNVKI